MPRILATVLSLVLCCETLQVAIAADSSTGPLADSVSREAARLAAGASVDVTTQDWQVLQQLSPGDRIIVTTSTASINGTFAGADSFSVTVRRGEAAERLKADDVLLIAVARRRGSAVAAALGTVGGIWLGSGVAYGLAENARCYESSCTGVKLGVLSAIIGVPIAAGYGAWRLSTHSTEEIVYRRR
jgi:hypothetical protein